MFIKCMKYLLGVFRGSSSFLGLVLGVALGITIGILPGISLLHILLAFLLLAMNLPLAPAIIALVLGRLVSHPLAYETYAAGKAVLSDAFSRAS